MGTITLFPLACGRAQREPKGEKSSFKTHSASCLEQTNTVCARLATARARLAAARARLDRVAY